MKLIGRPFAVIGIPACAILAAVALGIYWRRPGHAGSGPDGATCPPGGCWAGATVSEADVSNVLSRSSAAAVTNAAATNVSR